MYAFIFVVHHTLDFTGNITFYIILHSILKYYALDFTVLYIRFYSTVT